MSPEYIHIICVYNLIRYAASLIFKRPELTFRLEKSYFELNFKGFESEYQLKENFYVRSVAEADLNFHIDDVNDSKFFNDGLCKAP